MHECLRIFVCSAVSLSRVLADKLSAERRKNLGPLRLHKEVSDPREGKFPTASFPRKASSVRLVKAVKAVISQ